MLSSMALALFSLKVDDICMQNADTNRFLNASFIKSLLSTMVDQLAGGSVLTSLKACSSVLWE